MRVQFPIQIFRKFDVGDRLIIIIHYSKATVIYGKGSNFQLPTVQGIKLLQQLSHGHTLSWLECQTEKVLLITGPEII